MMVFAKTLIIITVVLKLISLGVTIAKYGEPKKLDKYEWVDIVGILLGLGLMCGMAYSIGWL